MSSNKGKKSTSKNLRHYVIVEFVVTIQVRS